MSTRKLVLLIMLLTLVVPDRLGIVLAAPRRAVSDWKLPLPPGEYKVPQGDQDSCYDTHCRGYVYGNQTTYCAIDLWVSNIAGMPVLAPADGTVIDVGFQEVGGGHYVYILHDDGFVSHYQHLQKVYVERNARLKQGQPFARVGATGSSDRRAWQEHLHFTVKTGRNGACVKLSSLDGYTDFRTNATVKSSNVQVGTLPDDLPAPITPAPPIPTKPAPPSSPARPSLSNPINSASMTQSSNVTLSWNTSANATQYKVELWGGPYSTMTPCDWQSESSCSIGMMNPGVMQWHVKARNTSGQESGWSDTWTFTIQGPTEIPPTKTSTPLPQAPGAPTLQDPSNGASYPQSQDVWFAWNYVSNANQYYLEYWGGPYGTLNSGWINDVAYHIGTMWPGTYKWHVKSRGQNGVESNWSDTWSFTVTQSATSIPPTSIPPTAVPPTQIPPTVVPQPPTATPQPSFTGNIAPQANRSPDGIGSGNAFDGDLSTFWIDGLGHAFSLELRLPDPLQVNRILVWDRPQNSPDNNQINALVIRLSNGMEGRFGMDSQGARCIDVTLSSPQTISSVTLKADDASGNNGLSEVEIWVGSKTGGPTCSNSGTMP